METTFNVYNCMATFNLSEDTFSFDDSSKSFFGTFLEPKSPNDGQWSEWGDWTKCDKTCGTGKQVRERTCTNPPPDPQGKDCQEPGEETQSCNVKECRK